MLQLKRTYQVRRSFLENGLASTSIRVHDDGSFTGARLNHRGELMIDDTVNCGMYCLLAKMMKGDTTKGGRGGKRRKEEMLVPLVRGAQKANPPPLSDFLEEEEEDDLRSRGWMDR